MPELYRFRNKDDKLIIVYMNDERSGSSAAKKFYEKGYDNIYLLSGGLDDFALAHPEMIVGKEVPDFDKIREEKALKEKKKNKKRI
jgi:centrosomal protein CEP41